MLYKQTCIAYVYKSSLVGKKKSCKMVGYACQNQVKECLGQFPEQVEFSYVFIYQPSTNSKDFTLCP